MLCQGAGCTCKDRHSINPVLPGKTWYRLPGSHAIGSSSRLADCTISDSSASFHFLPNPSVLFSFYSFFFLFFLFFFLLSQEACEILVSQPGIEHTPPALEAQSPNHWSTKEVPMPNPSTLDYPRLSPPLSSHLQLLLSLSDLIQAHDFEFHLQISPRFLPTAQASLLSSRLIISQCLLGPFTFNI